MLMFTKIFSKDLTSPAIVVHSKCANYTFDVIVIDETADKETKIIVSIFLFVTTLIGEITRIFVQIATVYLLVN